MSFEQVMLVAAFVLRALQEAPQLLAALESFWKTVSGNPVVPAHIEDAMQAAFTNVRAKQPPNGHGTAER